MLVVTDNSPLSALALTDWLWLLRERWSRVVLSRAVWLESRRLHDATALNRIDVGVAEGWLEVLCATDLALVARLEQKLDPGESEAIALAVELKADWLLMDELKGRKVARELGLQITGTLGLLIWAKSSGLLPSLRPAIQRLETVGELFLSEPLKAAALAAVGE